MIKRTKAYGALIALCLIVASPLHAAEQFKDGVDYKKLESPIETVDPSKVEVREFFWYGCSHCFQLEPWLEGWLEKKPADVNFVRTPAVMNKSWFVHGQAFYVAKTLGLENEIHKPLFDAMHKEHRKLSTQSALANFFAEHGVEKGRFNQIYESFGVNTAVQQASAAARKARITGVPSIIVNGKYLANGSMGKNYARMLEIVDFLIEKERGAIKKSDTPN